MIRPRTSCPECGRQTAASPSTGRLYPHRVGGQQCPGSGQRVDLYGTGVA